MATGINKDMNGYRSGPLCVEINPAEEQPGAWALKLVYVGADGVQRWSHRLVFEAFMLENMAPGRIFQSFELESCGGHVEYRANGGRKAGLLDATWYPGVGGTSEPVWVQYSGQWWTNGRATSETPPHLRRGDQP